MSKINSMALAIMEHEGFFKGSRSYRNHNPGNMKVPAGRGRVIDNDDQGHSIFPTFEAGFDALVDMLFAAAQGNSHTFTPDMTLAEFFHKYAENDTNYAADVAHRIGVAESTQIKDLL